VDFSWSVRRFLDAVKPDAVALVELEIWPNFVKACRGRGVPVCVINGRLSARSFRGYRRLRGFFKEYFRGLEFAAVQDPEYAARFEAMGVESGNCLITGSMKWDSAKIEDGAAGADDLARDMGILRGGPPLIVAGSTGPGEEALLSRAVQELERDIGPIQLLCAPRKPERFDEAAAAMGPCVRRSKAASPAALSGRGPRFLLDTIGELRRAYALADVVVVGRSFGDLFGSDPIEPIGLGKATVIGPAVSDFAQIVAEFEKGGGIVRATRESLREELRGLLTDGALRSRTGAAGRDVIRRMQGASARHAELLLNLVRA
jgi:3-deoxy-D-manno-octulosonic-acid transferase